MQSTKEAFRSVFNTIEKEALHWFPGHMNKGLKQMQQKLRNVDCVIEVHDARIPLSGRNNNFKYTISGIKPHILVLNKVDLIEPRMKDKITKSLHKACSNIIFTNCKDQQCRGVKELFPLANKLIQGANRYNRANEEDYSIMIIGVPNVGKSSLTNTLRNRFLKKSNASPVGAAPGVTRSVLNKIKICQNPLIYMLDTPGILTPDVPSTEVGLKLALCATIHDHFVGETVIADYLLYWLNKHEYFDYIDIFELIKASDDILEILTEIAVKNNKFIKIKDTSGNYVHRPDLEMAAKFMIKKFRAGELGKIVLDIDIMS